jgi:hypothetical protein
VITAVRCTAALELIIGIRTVTEPASASTWIVPSDSGSQ